MPHRHRRSLWTLVLLALTLLPLGLMAGQGHAAPLTTKYYSLALPPDWVVVNGPTRTKDAVQVLLGQKDHKASALIIAGPANPGEGGQAARAASRQLGGSAPVLRDGQWEFTFVQKGLKGYGVAREDAASKLLLMLIVSGDLKMADFVHQMRSPYSALVPGRVSPAK